MPLTTADHDCTVHPSTTRVAAQTIRLGDRLPMIGRNARSVSVSGHRVRVHLLPLLGRDTNHMDCLLDDLIYVTRAGAARHDTPEN